MFGREESEGIKPAIAEARARGHRISGPVPADSVFHLARIGRYDAVLSLYHDQGHIAAKMMDFEKTVSVTLGLPVLRTSVDHGTAFDIAGTGKADPRAAVISAAMMCDFLGEADASTRILNAVDKTDDVKGTTAEIGDAIAAAC